MALTAQHNEITFGVGDKVKVIQKIKEADKFRSQAFEGIVIGIKGRDLNKSFTVRRIGSQQVGIERIFPLLSPTIEKIEVLKKGTEGVRHAKLYYIRNKSRREIEAIYSRASKKNKQTEKKHLPKRKPKKRASKK